MKPVKQTFDTEKGNCLSACVASLLEIDLQMVPHFLGDKEDGSWIGRLADWLSDWDLCAVHVAFVNEDPGTTPAPEDLEYVSQWLKTRHVKYAIVNGYTKSGLPHSTIWKYGHLAHDPNPNPEPLLNVLSVIVIATNL